MTHACLQGFPRRGWPRLGPMLVAALSVVVLCGLWVSSASAGTAAQQLPYEGAIKADLAALSIPEADRKLLLDAYKARNYTAFWVDGTSPTPAAHALVRLLGEADKEGLDAAAYDVGRLQDWLAGRKPTTLTIFDVTLSAAVLNYGRDRLGARAATVSTVLKGLLPVPLPDGARTFTGVAGSADPVAALDSLGPRDAGYLGLKVALAEYRRIALAGGWPQVPAWSSEAVKLQPGLSDPRVPAYRARLAVTDGAPEVPPEQAELFDPGLVTALMRFQQRHGLIADGIPGRNTVRALNVPVEARVQQLVANLERARIRAVPADPYILVNIPEYRLRMVSGGQTIFDVPVVTGRPSRPTPLIVSSLSSVVLNPTWTVPIKLAGEDIVPKVLKDPEYLDKEGIRIFSSFSHDDVEIDPDTIDWQNINRKHFPYRLRQDPGPLNSLGRVKLNFPNTHDVYMHDTPDRHLLARDERAFSSGCIRVLNPVDLAEKILGSLAGWDRARIDATIATGTMVTLSVPKNISVRLVYETTWVAVDGAVNFRQDIYGHDAELVQTMGSHPRLAQNMP